jgi:3-deoxy-manno-octulosonate cytidylyltransferase (CMP-KDO synthetase)
LSAVVIIPARYASTRFPAKVLACKTGRPLVQHVVDQARRCRRVSDVIVAIDDPRIADALRPFETRCVMTLAHHASGTDRIAEVARGLTEEIIVNVQADEPEIEPSVIDALIEHLEQSGDDMATAATPFPAGASVSDPNLVKVVGTNGGRAIYFSRAVIPFWRDASDSSNPPTYHLHLGIYAYRRRFLLEYAAWPVTPCEEAEKLEQLRVLENGRSIGLLVVNRAAHGIDTPEQYADFVKRFGRHDS